ncbi:hypothetical protein [Halorubrum salinum]|nr:hypothetical protein [Halorubrum salinum]
MSACGRPRRAGRPLCGPVGLKLAVLLLFVLLLLLGVLAGIVRGLG